MVQREAAPLPRHTPARSAGRLRTRLPGARRRRSYFAPAHHSPLVAVVLSSHTTPSTAQPTTTSSSTHAMDEHSEHVDRFRAVTGASADQAAFMLEATHGNFEQAVQMFFDSHPSAAPPRGAQQQQQQQQQRQPNLQQPGQHGGGGGLLGLPLRLLGTGIHALASVVQLTLSIAAAVGDRVLPAALMRRARGVARSMLALAAEPPEASQQAAAFIANFEAAYGGSGARHPAWVASSWRDAATTAHRAFKFLLVYLHSPEHEDTDAYAREVLCCPEVVAYADEHFVAWGGSIRAPDAFSLSSRLSVSTYPCVALLAFSGSRTKLVAAAQGALRPRQLLAMMRRVQEEQSLMLTAERLEQEEREMSRQLLAEQNAEYEASLAADREREARRAEEQRVVQEAARAAAAEEARARAEAEATEQRRLQAAASIAARRQAKAASLPPEPAPGAEGSAAIRVRLPDGANAQRRFGAGDTVQRLYDWVDSLEGFECLRYSLVAAFPKRVFDAAGEGARVTLADAGLVPQGALFVQVHDGDDGDEHGQEAAQ